MTQNDTPRAAAPAAAAPRAAGPLTAFDGLSPLALQFAALDAELAEIGDTQDRTVMAAARKLRRGLREFEPSVTMIGQVKAGKTTLVNAMAGWEDLLPADVNPWTSVVTSLHMRPELGPHERRASFRFFSNEEWDRLVTQGGRVGEMANRAGAEEEFEKVRRQLEEMREKSKARLGRKFQMLLGQAHDYETFDEALIQRYVCLGDDFWEEADGTREQGRFADVTKSADLWFGRPDLPVGLCIKDTPGVNDTFMIREQITINALRGSRLCVMVLSAQQALSSVDLGLIRLISNVKSRDILIFVNRIDELADPAREVPEIRESIEQTLKSFDGPEKVDIIFGSAYWASHAVAGTCDALGEDSAQALLGWAEAQDDAELDDLTPAEMIWQLSGLPALGAAIAERVVQGPGARLVERTEGAIANLRTSVAAADKLRLVEDAPARPPALSADEMARKLDEIETQANRTLDAGLSRAQETFLSRIDKSHQTFLSRATSSLVRHLELYGESEIWTYDPSGLRMLLRSAYQVFARSANRAGQEAFDFAAAELSALYAAGFGMTVETSAIKPPPLPQATPPVALGQTIALDLKGSWWTRFWRRRRGYQAFFDDFCKLISEETRPVVAALREENADAYAMQMREELGEFIAAQRTLLLGRSDRQGGQAAAGHDAAAPREVRRIGGGIAQAFSRSEWGTAG